MPLAVVGDSVWVGGAIGSVCVTVAFVVIDVCMESTGCDGKVVSSCWSSVTVVGMSVAYSMVVGK
uniref:hypothetical protein n=1 Tax=Vibrio cholerae TaxID=666 RepID=UPI003075DF72